MDVKKKAKIGVVQRSRSSGLPQSPYFCHFFLIAIEILGTNLCTLNSLKLFIDELFSYSVTN